MFLEVGWVDSPGVGRGGYVVVVVVGGGGRCSAVCGTVVGLLLGDGS